MMTLYKVSYILVTHTEMSLSFCFKNEKFSYLLLSREEVFTVKLDPRVETFFSEKIVNTINIT
jgi:hypothetical protein